MSRKEGFWLDGPKLAVWLWEQELTEDVRQDSNHARALLKWKQGGKASVYVVDEMLTRVDRHLSELPDHFYISPELMKRKPMRPVKPSEISLLHKGFRRKVPDRALARTLNRSQSTVRHYRYRWERENGIAD